MESNIIFEMDQKLESFVRQYDLPNASIMPKITRYRRLDESIYPNDIWNVRERYYFFDFGLIFWELTFDTNSDHYKPNSVNNIELIDERSVESWAIDKKIRSCGAYKDHQQVCEKCDKSKRDHLIQCNSCDLIDTTLSNVIYFFRSEDETYQQMYNLITDTPPYIEDNRDFYVFTTKWRIQKDRHIVLIDDKDRSEEILNSIRWTSSLANGLQYHGDEILQRSLSDLPPYYDNTTSNDLVNYIEKFYQRFYYYSPELILSKTGPRLHLDSRILKTIKYSYECIIDPGLWDLTKEQYDAFIPQHFVPLMQLYFYIRITPSSRFNKLAEKINPMYYYDPPKKQFYRYTLSKTQQNILSKMAKEVVEENSTLQVKELAQQTKRKTYSKTGIMEELLGQKRGGNIEQVKKELEALSKHDILLEIDSTEIGRRGPSHVRYYLNPGMPFTEYFIQMHFSKLPEKRLSEITDKLFSSSDDTV